MHNYYIGVSFSKWAGTRAENNTALLTCVAINGYHSQVEYKWFRGDILLQEEMYPVLYTQGSGVYRCQMSSSEPIIDSWMTFKVTTGSEHGMVYELFMLA